MTAIGKMLVFLVLVLSLVWNFLTVNAYATRTNWRAEAKRYQAKADEAAKSATTMANLLADERAAAADARRSLEESNGQSARQIERLRTDRAALATQYEGAFAQKKDAGGAATRQDVIINSQGEQVTRLDKSDKAKDEQIKQLALERNKLSLEAQEARNAANGFKKQNETLSNQIARLQTEVESLKASGGVSGGLTGRKAAPVPADLRGTVEVVEGNLVQINVGADHGVKVGAVLKVQRVSPARYLGKLRIVTVDPKHAVGQFEIDRPSNDPAALPRAGDQVTPSTSN